MCIEPKRWWGVCLWWESQTKREIDISLVALLSAGVVCVNIIACRRCMCCSGTSCQVDIICGTLANIVQSRGVMRVAMSTEQDLSVIFKCASTLAKADLIAPCIAGFANGEKGFADITSFEHLAIARFVWE